MAVVASGVLDDSGGAGGTGHLVSINTDTATPTVAPLTGLLTPSLLVAGDAPLPPDAVERARRVKGVAGLTVVDAAQAQVAGRRVGLLGVDPSSFRAFTPRQSAESDALWQSVATGGLAVSFELSRDGSVPLGGVVQAGGAGAPGNLRVAAYASMGIEDVDAVVSRAQARTLGMPQGNGLVVSASKTAAGTLSKRLRKVLPPGTRVAVLQDDPPRRASAAKAPKAPKQSGPRVTGRPDGATGARTTVTGNLMTATMRDLVMELDQIFGPFPTIGCYRGGADAQDHAAGRACDFMEGPIGRMPSASAQRHGDQVAAYAVANARRLGVSYVIWKQHIWNVRFPGWRRMEDRGSITQNHYDHVHISVLR
ncbi:hypothetical protein [Actinomadura miaoliensis]|uniref:hypothetical protein n=1 Tax=Actinomadura miaoliensis TaxID=430685 RepID=UPI0031E50B0A